jgi:ATP-dependent Clp protease ATP-binding subunit ClpA
LQEKGVTFTIDDVSRKWIARHGYDPKMGARPMARFIQERIKKPLAEELLFGKLSSGGSVIVTIQEDNLVLNVVSVEKVAA